MSETRTDDRGAQFVLDKSFAVVGVDGRWQSAVKHELEWPGVVPCLQGVRVTLVAGEE